MGDIKNQESRIANPPDPLWYKDALIYEVHVRAFFDSNGDGIGDFPGLTQKLPYLQDLGVTCLWLLPFYPSPLRDDGYDIADYTTINPIYGTLDDFRRFLEEAHARRIRVLTELVINHTSDQHPWFQRARTAPKGSPERDYYVWSDADTTYSGTRIIFTDTEKSNWTFDAVAGQYYWHRFFAHQPDLNFDNPAVLEAVLDVMRFWFDMGVDALRLDAIPYLIERDGTINENLPETHDILKRIRREVDARYQGRVLLAEANQWPSDVRAYFGDGDECHMAFHFPLMPRMFMAIRQEERHPIIEIMNQTPEIPDACQWAIFLRNHDELTLEMVTDEERDYMYGQYAADPQMRINVGIRRRLAPLMENSRRRMELMNSLLFSMPGTPIIYYGDEIGMGDNVYLGDRNGVRTPMQWSSDRNAGFSRCDPARLFFPVIMDPVYGYEAISVEAQERSPFTLLHWMKRMIALRRQHQVFGRGSIEFISTDNRKVLTYVRRYQDEIVLCVANLSRNVQPVAIPLQAFAGLTPVEMLGQAEFPRIGDHPYFLTLAAYGFYWFKLQEVVVPVTARVVSAPEERLELPTLFAGVVWDSILDNSARTILERQSLARFLQRQRWFGAKARTIARAKFTDWVTLRRGQHPSFLTIVNVQYSDGGHEQYVVPLAMSSASDAETIERQFPSAIVARVSGARKGVLYDGLFDDGTCQILLAMMQDSREVTSRNGRLQGANVELGAAHAPADALTPIVRSTPDQSNTSVLFGRQLIMKMFRRLEAGPNPDVEISGYLTRAGFTRVPPLRGTINYRFAVAASLGGSEDPPLRGRDTAGGSTLASLGGSEDPSPRGGEDADKSGALPVRRSEESASLLMLQEYVPNQGNGWQVTIEELGRYFDRVIGMPEPRVTSEAADAYLMSGGAIPAEIGEAIRTYIATADVLGRRTGELHVQLAEATDDPAFAPEPYTSSDVAQTVAAMRRHAEQQIRQLQDRISTFDDRARTLAKEVLRDRAALLRYFDEMRQVGNGALRIRCHGDYHLGQVLVAEGDVIILDFEGEPARPIAERRAKYSPLRDIAGMLRSFSYAALTGLNAATQTRPHDVERLAPWAALWENWVSAVFLRTYILTTRDAGIVPAADDLSTLLQGFVLDKALYELGYELNNRPEWVRVPLAGLFSMCLAAPRPITPNRQ